jgi:NAD(P)-dependent dehydrogenase (short-subunit alcohol dehydrogenase family)
MARQGIEETAASLEVSPVEFREIAIGTIPIKRMAEAEEVASVVLYFCSHAASAITGQALNDCSGTTACTA